MRGKNTNGSMPAYQRIQATIRKRIEDGELHPGDAVESERELARLHQVSLMTARHSARSKILTASVVNGEHEIAARLALPSGSALIKVERVRHAADEPFALETCYLSADEFKGLDDALVERSSLFAILERDYGVELAYADEEIDATAADVRTAKLLAVPRGTSLLRIRQLIYTSKGTAAIYVLGLYLSGRHTLVIRRFR
jgi:GntR family transcriptional regulator